MNRLTGVMVGWRKGVRRWQCPAGHVARDEYYCTILSVSPKINTAVPCARCATHSASTRGHIMSLFHAVWRCFHCWALVLPTFLNIEPTTTVLVIMPIRRSPIAAVLALCWAVLAAGNSCNCFNSGPAGVPVNPMQVTSNALWGPWQPSPNIGGYPNGGFPGASVPAAANGNCQPWGCETQSMACV